ncbi:hypothetical protein KC726_02510 [Candidatus Woesebacteria bacterium]|nr:hypothetical protein [Candidatus Woesebacteria bacterium]
MIEYPVISKRVAFWVVVFSFIILIVSAVYSFFPRRQILTCTQGKTITIAVQYKNTTILIHGDNLEEILECLGKSMPFYDRSVEHIVDSVNYYIRSELAKRYAIGPMISEGSFTIGDEQIIYHNKPFRHTIVSSNNANAIVIHEANVNIILLRAYFDHNQIDRCFISKELYEQNKKQTGENLLEQCVVLEAGNKYIL